MSLYDFIPGTETDKQIAALKGKAETYVTRFTPGFRHFVYDVKSEG